MKTFEITIQGTTYSGKAKIFIDFIESLFSK